MPENTADDSDQSQTPDPQVSLELDGEVLKNADIVSTTHDSEKKCSACLWRTTSKYRLSSWSPDEAVCDRCFLDLLATEEEFVVFEQSTTSPSSEDVHLTPE